MACGTVIGGTSVGILDDLAPRTAFAVPTGDYVALAEKILSALTDPSEYHRLRTNGLAWSASHTAKAMVLKHEELYRSLVKRGADA
jgi:glycosyltransferase involved in cell wall biosynthesis